MKKDSNSNKPGEKLIEVAEFASCTIKGRKDFDCTNS